MIFQGRPIPWHRDLSGLTDSGRVLLVQREFQRPDHLGSVTSAAQQTRACDFQHPDKRLGSMSYYSIYGSTPKERMLGVLP